MADNRDFNKEDIDRDEIAKAARNPEQAKKDGAHLFGEGMTTPDSTKVPYTSEGEPDYRALNGKDAQEGGMGESGSSDRSSRLGREESER